MKKDLHSERMFFWDKMVWAERESMVEKNQLYIKATNFLLNAWPVNVFSLHRRCNTNILCWFCVHWHWYLSVDLFLVNSYSLHCGAFLLQCKFREESVRCLATPMPIFLAIAITICTVSILYRSLPCLDYDFLLLIGFTEICTTRPRIWFFMLISFTDLLPIL